MKEWDKKNFSSMETCIRGLLPPWKGDVVFTHISA